MKTPADRSTTGHTSTNTPINMNRSRGAIIERAMYNVLIDTYSIINTNIYKTRQIEDFERKLL